MKLERKKTLKEEEINKIRDWYEEHPSSTFADGVSFNLVGNELFLVKDDETGEYVAYYREKGKKTYSLVQRIFMRPAKANGEERVWFSKRNGDLPEKEPSISLEDLKKQSEAAELIEIFKQPNFVSAKGKFKMEVNNPKLVQARAQARIQEEGKMDKKEETKEDKQKVVAAEEAASVGTKTKRAELVAAQLNYATRLAKKGVFSDEDVKKYVDKLADEFFAEDEKAANEATEVEQEKVAKRKAAFIKEKQADLKETAEIISEEIFLKSAVAKIVMPYVDKNSKNYYFTDKKKTTIKNHLRETEGDATKLEDWFVDSFCKHISNDLDISGNRKELGILGICQTYFEIFVRFAVREQIEQAKRELFPELEPIVQEKRAEFEDLRAAVDKFFASTNPSVIAFVQNDKNELSAYGVTYAVDELGKIGTLETEKLKKSGTIINKRLISVADLKEYAKDEPYRKLDAVYACAIAMANQVVGRKLDREVKVELSDEEKQELFGYIFEKLAKETLTEKERFTILSDTVDYSADRIQDLAAIAKFGTEAQDILDKIENIEKLGTRENALTTEQVSEFLERNPILKEYAEQVGVEDTAEKWREYFLHRAQQEKPATKSDSGAVVVTASDKNLPSVDNIKRILSTRTFDKRYKEAERAFFAKTYADLSAEMKRHAPIDLTLDASKQAIFKALQGKHELDGKEVSLASVDEITKIKDGGRKILIDVETAEKTIIEFAIEGLSAKALAYQENFEKELEEGKAVVTLKAKLDLTSDASKQAIFKALQGKHELDGKEVSIASVDEIKEIKVDEQEILVDVETAEKTTLQLAIKGLSRNALAYQENFEKELEEGKAAGTLTIEKAKTDEKSAETEDETPEKGTEEKPAETGVETPENVTKEKPTERMTAYSWWSNPRGAEETKENPRETVAGEKSEGDTAEQTNTEGQPNSESERTNQNLVDNSGTNGQPTAEGTNSEERAKGDAAPIYTPEIGDTVDRAPVANTGKVTEENTVEPDAEVAKPGEGENTEEQPAEGEQVTETNSREDTNKGTEGTHKGKIKKAITVLALVGAAAVAAGVVATGYQTSEAEAARGAGAAEAEREQITATIDNGILKSLEGNIQIDPHYARSKGLEGAFRDKYYSECKAEGFAERLGERAAAACESADLRKDATEVASYTTVYPCPVEVEAPNYESSDNLKEVFTNAGFGETQAEKFVKIYAEAFQYTYSINFDASKFDKPMTPEEKTPLKLTSEDAKQKVFDVLSGKDLPFEGKTYSVASVDEIKEMSSDGETLKVLAEKAEGTKLSIEIKDKETGTTVPIYLENFSDWLTTTEITLTNAEEKVVVPEKTPLDLTSQATKDTVFNVLSGKDLNFEGKSYSVEDASEIKTISTDMKTKMSVHTENKEETKLDIELVSPITITAFQEELSDWLATTTITLTNVEEKVVTPEKTPLDLTAEESKQAFVAALNRFSAYTVGDTAVVNGDLTREEGTVGANITGADGITANYAITLDAGAFENQEALLAGFAKVAETDISTDKLDLKSEVAKQAFIDALNRTTKYAVGDAAFVIGDLTHEKGTETVGAEIKGDDGIIANYVITLDASAFDNQNALLGAFKLVEESDISSPNKAPEVVDQNVGRDFADALQGVVDGTVSNRSFVEGNKLYIITEEGKMYEKTLPEGTDTSKLDNAELKAAAANAEETVEYDGYTATELKDLASLTDADGRRNFSEAQMQRIVENITNKIAGASTIEVYAKCEKPATTDAKGWDYVQVTLKIVGRDAKGNRVGNTREFNGEKVWAKGKADIDTATLLTLANGGETTFYCDEATSADGINHGYGKKVNTAKPIVERVLGGKE